MEIKWISTVVGTSACGRWSSADERGGRGVMDMLQRYRPARLVLVGALLLLGLASCVTTSDPVVDRSTTSRKLSSLAPAQGPKPKVTIYQFNSTVPEISPASATDMFMTALIKSRRFMVLERQRLNESVYREKQMNQQGMTTGNTAQYRLTGADYVFVGTVTEANPTSSRTGVAGTYRGLGVETSGEKGEIGLDIRVLDARTGAVLDAVNVRKEIAEGGFSVSGVGAFLRSVTKKNLKGADVAVSHDRKEGVDKALRACIEEAIYELARRYAP